METNEQNHGPVIKNPDDGDVPHDSMQDNCALPEPITCDQAFIDFEESYSNLKKTVENKLQDLKAKCNSQRDEIRDLKVDYSMQERKLKGYEERVYARDIMGIILQSVSDIYNAVLDYDDDSEHFKDLKASILGQIDQLAGRLRSSGVTILKHDREEICPNDMTVRHMYPVETKDISLDGKIARSTKMGCIIKGEAQPIPEEVSMYVYKQNESPKETPLNPTITLPFPLMLLMEEPISGLFPRKEIQVLPIVLKNTPVELYKWTKFPIPRAWSEGGTCYIDGLPEWRDSVIHIRSSLVYMFSIDEQKRLILSIDDTEKNKIEKFIITNPLKW